MDFDLLKEKTTHVQVWARFYHLPWFLWEPTIFAELARQIGTLLKYDKATVEVDFSHFAHVLIDVDLAKLIKQSVLLECRDTAFDVKVVLEKVPASCKACSTIGHVSVDCRMLKKGKKGVREATTKKVSDVRTEQTALVQDGNEKSGEVEADVENIQAEKVQAKATPVEVAPIVEKQTEHVVTSLVVVTDAE